MSLEFEKAKNHMITCKLNGKYIYSKYVPEKVTVNFVEEIDAPYILIVGYGLGYEVASIRSLTNKKIVVVEANRQFESYMYEVENCDVYFMDEISSQFTINRAAQIWINEQIVQLEPTSYSPFLNRLVMQKRSKIIWCIKHHFLIENCANHFKKLGYQVEMFDYHEMKQVTFYENTKPDLVFGLGYSIGLAKALNEHNIKYAAWLIDSPQFQLELEDAFVYKNAYIFTFDAGLVELFNKNQQNQLFYMPLAADVEKFDAITVSEDEYEKYRSDIVFIGDSGKNNKFLELDIFNVIDGELRSEIESYIELQLDSDNYKLRDYTSEKHYLEIMKMYRAFGTLQIDNYIKQKRQYEFILSHQVTHIQRTRLANCLEKFEGFTIYGDQGWLATLNDASHYKGKAGYDLEAYKIMKSSKININDTRPFFEDAIPLRIFETLGTGAFCVTNARQTNNPTFIDGKHLVIYRDLQDLQDITNYYLSHEEQRLEIALQGYLEIKKNHSLDVRLKQILTILNM